MRSLYARLHSRFGEPIDRRDMIRRSLAAAAGVLLAAFVLIPALGSRLVRNGVEAKGRSWPREREGRPFSTSALAFSESWTQAI